MTFEQFSVKFLLNDFTGMLKKEKLTFATCKIRPQELRFVLLATYHGVISRNDLRDIVKRNLR